MPDTQPRVRSGFLVVLAAALAIPVLTVAIHQVVEAYARADARTATDLLEAVAWPAAGDGILDCERAAACFEYDHGPRAATRAVLAVLADEGFDTEPVACDGSDGCRSTARVGRATISVSAQDRDPAVDVTYVSVGEPSVP